MDLVLYTKIKIVFNLGAVTSLTPKVKDQFMAFEAILIK